jgi:hypothetical protein
MAHIRKQVRDAVVAEVTGLATTGARVYTEQVAPLDPSQLPALLVSTPAEDAEQSEKFGGVLVRREITVDIAIKVKTGTPVATLDAIAEQVETALGTTLTVAGAPVDVDYVGMQSDLSDDADRAIGSMVLRFTVTVWTEPGAPGVLAAT